MPRKSLLLLSASLLFLVSLYFLLKQGKTVSYNGIVVDSKTGTPISGAKVVITTSPYGVWDASPNHTGTLTQSDGSFSIVANREYWISKSIISAISKDSLFIREKIDLKTEDGRLKLRPISKNYIGISEYSFDNFSGGWSGEVIWHTKTN
ncbi:MAG: carboxypeptidase-like regulatory domain-containing protein [Akkermansiaceae bacterium]